MTIFDLLNEVLVIGLATSYIVNVLRIKYDDQIEPRSVVFKRRIVLVDANGQTTYQLWSLFDYLRSVFGAYSKTEYTDNDGFAIYERTDAINIWMCSKCLSFWVAGLICLIAELFLFANPFNAVVVLWLASAGLSTALSKD